VESTAALFGSVAQPGVNCQGDGLPGPCGLEVTVDNVTDAYVQSDHPVTEPRIETTFRLRNNNLSSGGVGNRFFIFYLAERDVGPQRGHIFGYIKRNNLNTAWKLIVRSRNDDGSTRKIANFRVFDGTGAPDGSQEIKIVWQASSAPGADDGVMEVWKNGIRKDIGFPGAPGHTGATFLTDLDNDTYNVDAVKIGVVFSSQASNMSGSYHFDEYSSTR
jgi:hypothetical protein